MEPFIARIILSFVLCLWLLLCAAAFRRFRAAAWLAASTSATCLFFLGATIAISFLVSGALFLLPLWAGVGVLIAVHLFSACRTAGESSSLSKSGAIHQAGESAAGDSPAAQGGSDAYI